MDNYNADNKKANIRCSVFENQQNKKNKYKSAIIIENKPPLTKTSPEISKLQQNFQERFFGAQSQNNAYSENNIEGSSNKSTAQPQNNEMNTLSQIAPIFNLLNGGKNPQLGNLISTLTSGNMDMNKMLNAMVQNQGTIQASAKEKQENNTKKTTTTNNDSQIKKLKRI